MTPREALDALRGLDVAVAKAFSGAQFDYSYGHPTIAGSGGWIVPMLRWDALRLAASSARPALETLAGCVVLPLGTAQDLVAFGNAVSREWGLGQSEMRSLVEAERAIADAEEAMR